jgi:hypothetical protein
MWLDEGSVGASFEQGFESDLQDVYTIGERGILSMERMPGISQYLTPQARAVLQGLDKQLESLANYFSLAPHLSRPTSCEQLVGRLSNYLVSAVECEALTQCLSKLVEATREHFPGNLFWDFDCMLGCLVRCAVLSDQPTASYIQGYTEKMENLFRLYGRQSLICFQYTHDFLYGYDYEQWYGRAVLPEPECYEFSESYLEFLIQKGNAITRQIEREVPGYQQLKPGEFRNTFTYPRDAATEELVMRSVVAEGCLPIVAWSCDGQRNREAGRLYRDERAAIATRIVGKR